MNRSPQSIRPYLQLSRLDRPVGYWLLALPGWIGLAFASLSHGFATSDVKWAMLILIGAIAMRGAGCTYNDVVDQDLDAQVERTALRPLPAGTVTTKQAWIWLFSQCGVGLIVLLCLPRLAQIISLCSIPLVAAYPFMKRITWWPQLWLGMTFNWAVLVTYAAKTGIVSLPLFILYAGLIFWTVGYDTIYACQDIEDDMKIGVKSTARRFGKQVKLGVGFSYFILLISIHVSLDKETLLVARKINDDGIYYSLSMFTIEGTLIVVPLWFLFIIQLIFFKQNNPKRALTIFKASSWIGVAIITIIIFYGHRFHQIPDYAGITVYQYLFENLN